ncbi:integrase arm-type DNA-binding domain-containing protein [Vibrio alginolyticus]|nr:integrase arm-type DNA-binding domain-containing protein [Vibrio alginolyticus]
MGNLTVNQVKAIVKDQKTGRHADGDGFYLMIPRVGRPYWMLRYTLFKKRKEVTIGKVDELSLADARLKASELRKQISEGINPIAERKRSKQADIQIIDDLFEDWYKDLSKRLKHPNIPKRIYQKEISPQIGQYTLKRVTPLDIRNIIQIVADSDRPTTANDTLMYCKQLFKHGMKIGVIESNPALAFSNYDAGGIEESRDRVLELEEIKHVFSVFNQNIYSFNRDNYLACALLLCLGVRKSELTEAKWTEFDLDNALWHLPAERSKSGTGFTIPLPELCIQWFKELYMRACGSEYVFPNRRESKVPHMGKDTLNRAISKLFGREPGRKVQPPNKMGDIKHFAVHDLRRTCRSLLASVKVPSHIAERCLNHKLKGVEGIYDRYDYLEERKEALNKVTSLIRNHIEHN